MNEVKRYTLTPEELQKYKDLKPPKKEKASDFTTFGPQSNRKQNKYTRKGGESW